MGAGLIKHETDLMVQAATDKSLGDVFKPLKQEIHLFDTYIAGTAYIKETELFDALGEGDSLILQREDNRYDEKAILVLNSDRKKLGYIPERDNVVFSRLMDAGKYLMAKIKKIDPKGSMFKISIAIYMVDF